MDVLFAKADTFVKNGPRLATVKRAAVLRDEFARAVDKGTLII